ncbi:MAG: hypothetical protein RPT95_16800 [Candidatus Sedimenticola sp. (ex Thyasira tokunagai)]
MAIHAELINKMKPYLLGILTTVAMKGTVLHRQMVTGEFKLLDSYEVLEEMKILLEHIDLQEMYADATHASNMLPIKGLLKDTKSEIFSSINKHLQNKDKSLIGKPYVGQF